MPPIQFLIYKIQAPFLPNSKPLPLLARLLNVSTGLHTVVYGHIVNERI